MAINNFSVTNIISRITLFLPSRFSREAGTEVHAFLGGIAELLKINSDEIDELFRQTNLASATGHYVDLFIEGLSNLGRNKNEADAKYKDRYRRNVYVYNSTKEGIRQIVIDIGGDVPEELYSAGKRGAYMDSRYYYNDVNLRSTYGNADPTAFTGFIHLKQKPRESALDELCKTINRNKAAGTKIYFFYPQVAFGYGNNGYGEGEYGNQ